MFHFIGSCLRWVFGWLYYVCIICFAGAMLGVLTHMVFAVLFVDNPDYGFYAAFGFTNGFRYGGVWAGGLAIVLCVMRARKEYLANHQGASQELER
ncbi:MAG: hypothetical protein AAF546_02290 [Verrucomicrobiota bacterium]